MGSPERAGHNTLPLLRQESASNGNHTKLVAWASVHRPGPWIPLLPLPSSLNLTHRLFHNRGGGPEGQDQEGGDGRFSYGEVPVHQPARSYEYVSALQTDQLEYILPGGRPLPNRHYLKNHWTLKLSQLLDHLHPVSTGIRSRLEERWQPEVETVGLPPKNLSLVNAIVDENN